MKGRDYFPALRGRLGDWAYYSVLMTMDQLVAKVHYAKEIHNSDKLSQLIQRHLDDKKRAGEIGDYLTGNPDRFFNSLVVAVYDGDPEWHEFQKLQPISKDIDIDDLSYSARYSVGYLSFIGTEKLFALDGQHRLAGIRRALKSDKSLGSEEISVIVVAHHTDAKGLQRTRKLFTTLNKTAKPVSKSEIIALDESDAMAITARGLVENDSRFSDALIDVLRKQANLPNTDTTHLMTLINIYDILEFLFVKSVKGAKKSEFTKRRPTDDELARYLHTAIGYFTYLERAFPVLGRCFKAKQPETVIKKYRRNDGGNVLFRPVGLLIFSEIAAVLMRTQRMTLETSVAKLKLLPTELGEYPYKGALWNTQTNTIEIRHKALTRDLLLHYIGYFDDSRKLRKVGERYAAVLGGTTTDFSLRQYGNASFK
jgi:DNA sulfur modification protein DndB